MFALLGQQQEYKLRIDSLGCRSTTHKHCGEFSQHFILIVQFDFLYEWRPRTIRPRAFLPQASPLPTSSHSELVLVLHTLHLFCESLSPTPRQLLLRDE